MFWKLGTAFHGVAISAHGILYSLLVKISEELKKRRSKDCSPQPSHLEDASRQESATTAPSSGASDTLEQHSIPGVGKTLPHSALPHAAVPQSDAILSCPACMSTLCLDCQRCVCLAFLINHIIKAFGILSSRQIAFWHCSPFVSHVFHTCTLPKLQLLCLLPGMEVATFDVLISNQSTTFPIT